MRLLQNTKIWIKLILGFSLVVSIAGFITVFLGLTNIDTIDTLMTMIVLSIAAVILGITIALVVIVGIVMSLLNGRLGYVTSGDLTKTFSAMTKQPRPPTLTVRVTST